MAIELMLAVVVGMMVAAVIHWLWMSLVLVPQLDAVYYTLERHNHTLNNLLRQMDAAMAEGEDADPMYTVWVNKNGAHHE